VDHQVVVRLDERIGRLVREVAGARGQDLSNFLGAIIKAELARLSYLSAQEKKAPGIRLRPQITLGDGSNPEREGA